MKFLIVFGLIIYLIYKIGTLFFRAGAASQQHRNYYQPPKSNVNDDPNAAKANKGGSKFKGGEYIDYEEVK